MYMALSGGAAFLALLVTPVVRPLAIGLGAVDEPGGRREHVGRVPRLGGVALLVAVLGALTSGRLLGFPVFQQLLSRGWKLDWFIAGVLIIVCVGIIDDVRTLGPLPKLGGEVLAAGVALAGGYGFDAITNPFTGGLVGLGAFGKLLTLLWIVGITNAFNLIDGLDGLAAGVGVIAASTIGAIATLQGRPDVALLSATLAGALLGFLCFNWGPASIFLGDSGSLLLGYVLSLLALQGLQKGPTLVVLLVPVLALGFPIVDTLVTVLRRFVGEGSAAVLRGDREHIHHRLVTRGMTPRQAVLLLYIVSGALGVLAFLAVLIGGPGSAALVALAAGGAYLAVRTLGYLS